MPRTKFECNPESYYHVTNRCINKEWFCVPIKDVWRIMGDELYFIKHAFGLEIYSFVLMNNHFHLLVRAPLGNLSEAMAFFSAMTSRRIVKKGKRVNHMWAHRFKRCEIKSYQYFLNTYKYIYQNPIRAGICDRVENYPYSTLYGLLGKSRIGIPVAEDTIFYGEKWQDYFNWMNTIPSDEEIDWMKKALRRATFKYPSCRGKKNPLEERRL